MALGLGVSLARADPIKTPADIAAAGKIVYCAAVGAPPLSFYREDGSLVGMEIDSRASTTSRSGARSSTCGPMGHIRRSWPTGAWRSWISNSPLPMRG